MSQMSIQVTDCRIYLNERRDERFKAYGSIVLNQAFAIQVKVINGIGGLFVAMPALPRKDGMFHDVAHPITRELRDHIEDVVLRAYNQQIGDTDVKQGIKQSRVMDQPGFQRNHHHYAIGA